MKKVIWKFKRWLWSVILKVIPLKEIENKINPISSDYRIVEDDIVLPSKFREEFSHDDLTSLLNLLKEKTPKRVLELGTAHGNTVANIALNFDCEIYTVNALPEQLSGEVTTFSLSKNEIGRVYRKYDLKNITQIYENTLSMNLEKYIQKKSIDFAIIDACHDKEYVINDFLKIKPYLNIGATVVLHDTHPSREGHLIGSYDACIWLKLKGYNIKRIKDTWWGIYINK